MLALIKPLIWRLGLVFILFSFCRLLFWASNYSYFPEISVISFIGGLRFDLSSLFAINSILIILSLVPWMKLQQTSAYRRFLLILFVLANGIAFGFEIADIEYFKFTLKRSTSDLIELMQAGDDMLNLAPSFIKDYWYLVLAWLLIIALLLKTGLKTYTLPIALRGWRNWLSWAFFFSSIIGLSVVAIRGGLQLRPLSSISASAYGGNRSVPVVLNTSFSLLKSAGKERLPDTQYYKREKLDKLFDPVLSFHSDSSFQAKNVIILILESFSEEYIGYLSGKESFTPFLDSLIRESTRSEQAFANGRKSMEAVPAILSSTPAWMTRPYITSSYSANHLSSLTGLLKEKSYSSYFFHGGNNGTMGFDRFAESIEVDQYFGREEYGNDEDYDGQWGIYDEPFLQYCIRVLDEKPEPFVGTIFTLSSHHPYSLPEKYRGQFKEGDLPIHPTIQYTDLALRKFFERARKSAWFENTIFVVTADHTQLSNSEYYLSKLGQYRIPLFYYLSGESGRVLKGNTQQIDIMPSILDKLHYSGDLICFGSSIFGDQHSEVVMTYLNGQYQIIMDQYVGYFDGEKMLSMYDHYNDPLLQDNLLETLPEMALSIETEAKARIQSFNYRMNHNELYLGNR